MALIVQDESGSIDAANSYVTLDEFKDYHELHGNSLGTLTDEELEAAIVRATDYLDSAFQFIGYRMRPEQRTQWPRIDAVDVDGWVRFGVPHEVKEAACEYGLVAANQEINPNPSPNPSGQPLSAYSSQVSSIAESFQFAGSGFILPRYPAADKKLSRLIVSGEQVYRA